MATKKKHRTQESWPGFDEGLDAVPSGDYVTPGGGRYERTTPPTLTGAAAARAKRLLGVCELEGGCQKVAGHDGPCTRRNPHEQYYGDEEAPEDAERMRRLKAISDAALARKNPAKKRPTGQCVSCGAVCAVYGDPPICHPCDVVMAQEEHAEREGIPGRPGYKKSPGRKNPAEHFTAFEAAKEFAKYLKRAGYKDAAAWDREMVQRTGWDPTADAQVALEGGPDLSLLQLYSKGPFKAGMQPWPGVHCEAFNSWLMSFYDRE